MSHSGEKGRRGFPDCVLRMGISGGQSGCKLQFPWVAWLSLGLCSAGRDEVCGLLMDGVSSKGFPGSPGVWFGWILAWPLRGALRMGGAAHPCVMSNSAWVTWSGSRADPTLLLLWGPWKPRGKLQTLVYSGLGNGHPEPWRRQVTSPPWSSGMSSWWQLPHRAERGK